MFNKLNEDSWAIILKYLQLKDQLSLMHISEYMSSNVQKHWKRINEAEMDEYVLNEFKKEPPKMHTFLQSSCGSLQKLFIEGPHIDTLLPEWQAYDFPNLRSLHFQLQTTDHNVDNVTSLLSKLFPKLTKLKLFSLNHGRYLCDFRQLEELSLHSSSLNTSALEKIFETLPLRKLSLFPFCTYEDDDLSLIYKCETLEELLVDDYNLSYNMLGNLLDLPRFQRLSFYTQNYYDNFTYYVKELNKEFRVQSLVFNSCSWFFDNVGSCISRFSNLSRLVLQDDDIDKKELFLICSSLQHLVELHLIEIRDFPLASELWSMVEVCESLKVLNISYNKLDRCFLDESSTCLHRVLEKRNAHSPITFHVYETRLAKNPQETSNALNHPNFKISFDPVHIYTLADPDQPFIESEFRPLS